MLVLGEVEKIMTWFKNLLNQVIFEASLRPEGILWYDKTIVCMLYIAPVVQWWSEEIKPFSL